MGLTSGKQQTLALEPVLEEAINSKTMMLTTHIFSDRSKTLMHPKNPSFSDQELELVRTVRSHSPSNVFDIAAMKSFLKSN